MPLSLVQGPSAEPLTVVEARNHLRVPTEDDDPYLLTLIQVVRQRAERATNRDLITHTWDYFLDTWPQWNGYHGGQPFEPVTSLVPAGGWIWLPRAPLQAVSVVQYTALDGSTQTWDPSNYSVDAPAGDFCARGRLSLGWVKVWPVVRPVANAIRIRFTSGYGTAASSVPALLRQAMLLDMGTLFDIRASVLSGARAQAIEIPSTSKDIYRSFKCR